MASPNRPSSLASQAAKERILVGAARDIGQLLLARILVALHVQGADLKTLQIAQQLLIVLEIEAHLGGHLMLARRVPKARRQNPDRLFDCTALAAELARAPVEGPQTVKNRAPYAELRIAAELYFFGRVELGKGIEQSHHAGRDQVFDIDVLGQPLVNPAGEKANNRQVLEQHPLLFASQHTALRRRRRIRRHSGRTPDNLCIALTSCRLDSHLFCRPSNLWSFRSNFRKARLSEELTAPFRPAAAAPPGNLSRSNHCQSWNHRLQPSPNVIARRT